MKGQRITFSGQVANYKNTVSQVVELLGDENTAADYLRRCIYTIGMGSNDYLNNYFMPQFYATSRQYNPEQYAEDLINRYKEQLNVSILDLSTVWESSVFLYLRSSSWDGLLNVMIFRSNLKYIFN